MSHPDEGVLQELLDGELPPADAAAVRAHLAGCVPCAVVLRDLAATQSESDAIVARLPLDPPLARPAKQAGRRSAMNLRAIGLAASVVLVAGTSWMLLRSRPLGSFGAGDESASGLALPMPSEERQEVPATTPAVPPAAVAPTAGARADRSDDLHDKAKQAPQEADAPAAPPVAKDLASQAVPQPEQEAKKKEAADEPGRANEAHPANAPAPLARVAPPAAAGGLTLGAAKASGATQTTVADAEARLGLKVFTIAGLTPVSVEFPGDSARAVRQRYLVSGVPVVLLQEDLGFNTHDRIAPRRRVADSAGVHLTTVTWWSGGYRFDLQGALPADSLEALLKQLK